MRTVSEWFLIYGESHQNRTNKRIHWLCIPAILLSTLGLLQTIPHPFGAGPYLSWATLAVLASLVFYLRLSWTLGLGFGLVSTIALAVNAAIAAAGLSLFWVSIGVFSVAWAGQFVGHKIEGKKPSFFQDLQFLLIGPAWLLGFVFDALGIPVETKRVRR